MINTIILYGEIYDKNIHTLYLNSNEIIRISNGIGQLQNLRELYLRYNNITEISNEIGQLQNLQKLDLSNNQITQIPNEIGHLQNLQDLYLSNNYIIGIPNEICQLLNLQTLELNNNEITQIPNEIGQLRNLRKLELNDNQIIKIPNEIGQLQNLRKLDLNNNQITQIQNEIGHLQNLQELGLSHNKITQIANEICHLQNLRELYLYNNKITQIPNEIGKLRNLQIFYLNNNNIIIIPANIIQCNNLRQITYHGNNIEHNIPCVQRFLDRIRNAGGTIINMYNDKQNVHTSSIQTSIKNSIFHLLNVNYIINEMNNYIEDLVLTIKTKQLITEYISLNETHSDLDCTFEEIFKAVWNEILTFEIDIQNDVKKRLNEEMDDAECKCFTGRISRLVNCLSGYTNKVSIQISDAEQIGNIISHIKSTHNDSSIDEIRQIVRNELTEHGFNQDIIEEWILFIN